MRVRAALEAREADPLTYFRYGVPRLREAFGLLADDVAELHLRGPNKGGKTYTVAAYVLACLQKRPTLDGAPLPQWRGKVEAAQLVLDYKQQLLSVQPAYLRALGRWPHHARYLGETLTSLAVKPVGGSDDESTWSVIHYLSQKNIDTGVGVRADLVAFDEPPDMEVLRELRKAAHAGRRGIRIIGETPTKRREWAPLRDDYGDTPRRTIRRVDEQRAEVRWSLDEVENWVLSAAEKRALWQAYRKDPLFGEDGGARWHGDYTNTEGSCPYDAATLLRMIAEWSREPEGVNWRVTLEAAGGRPAEVTRVPVQLWRPWRQGMACYIAVDPASGVDDGKHNPAGLHVCEKGSGELLARWNGYLAPYSVGVLAAGLAQQYGGAAIDIEMKDHWGVNVVRGVQASGYGHLCHEQRELAPGKWAHEVGFDQNEETRAIIIGQLQEWIAAFAAGQPYALCPSREVLESLLDTELDDRGKIVAIPGISHGEDMILRGQSLRRCVARHYKQAPKPQAAIKTPEQQIAAMIRGEGEDDDMPETGRFRY